MSSPNYKEFTDYTRFWKSLVRRGGAGEARQREFLESALDSQTFLDYMDRSLQVTGTDELEPLADRMSEAEFKDPPGDTEQRLYEGWADLKPRVACRTSFWAYVTRRHIEGGRIESHFLAANGGAHPSGSAHIQRALDASGNGASTALDGCVRNVLRRLGGLPERGNRTVYVNCPLSRSWWRERFVQQASEENTAVASQVRRVVRVNQSYWEELVNFVVSRNSVFGSLDIRAALVKTLGRHLAEDPQSPLQRKEHFLTPACRSLSTVQASRELSVLPSRDAEAVVRDVVEMHLNALRRGAQR